MLEEIQDSVVITHDMSCDRNYQTEYITHTNEDSTSGTYNIFTSDLKQNKSAIIFTNENTDSDIEKTTKTTNKLAFEGVDFIQPYNKNTRYNHNDISIHTHAYKMITSTMDHTDKITTDNADYTHEMITSTMDHTEEITTDNADYTHKIIMETMDYTHKTTSDIMDYQAYRMEKNIIIIIISCVFSIISCLYIICLIGIYTQWRKHRNYTSSPGIIYY
jgi:hypothetical protein